MRFSSIALMASAILASVAWAAEAAPAAAHASARPQQAARHQLYDDNGDLVFEAPSEALATFHNRTHWRNAAYCVALNSLVEYKLDELRTKLPKQGKTWDESTVQNPDPALEQDSLRWREFAMHRLRIDHPHVSNFDALFDAEVAAQIPVIRSLDWTPEPSIWSTRWGSRAGACRGYRNNIEGLVYNMQNGRGAGSRGAPRN